MSAMSTGRKRSRSDRSSGGATIPETDGGFGGGASTSNSSRSGPRGRLAGLLFQRQRRGRLPAPEQAALLHHAERRAITSARGAYVSLPPSTKSTIAVAVSPCGRFVASTHGDHTVKVTEFHTGQLLHTLVRARIEGGIPGAINA